MNIQFHLLGRLSNIRVSMLEIYNDECRDLLHPEIPSRDIALREDKEGRMFFTGAREEIVSDKKSALNFLEIGNMNRSTAETMMNQSSSRSHVLLFSPFIHTDYYNLCVHFIQGNIYHLNGTSRIQSEESFCVQFSSFETNLFFFQGELAPSLADAKSQNGSYIQAKLHLVDLAGSERAKKTGAVGARLKESVGINQVILSNIVTKDTNMSASPGLAVVGEGDSSPHGGARGSACAVQGVQADSILARLPGRQQPHGHACLHICCGIKFARNSEHTAVCFEVLFL